MIIDVIFITLTNSPSRLQNEKTPGETDDITNRYFLSAGSFVASFKATTGEEPEVHLRRELFHAPIYTLWTLELLTKYTVEVNLN